MLTQPIKIDKGQMKLDAFLNKRKKNKRSKTKKTIKASIKKKTQKKYLVEKAQELEIISTENIKKNSCISMQESEKIHENTNPMKKRGRHKKNKVTPVNFENLLVDKEILDPKENIEPIDEAKKMFKSKLRPKKLKLN